MLEIVLDGKGSGAILEYETLEASDGSPQLSLINSPFFFTLVCTGGNWFLDYNRINTN